MECAERGLDPFVSLLVVADPTRTDKTICLAISPAMKAIGVKNRCRVFEIPKHLKYITAPPRMQLYIDYAAEIYSIYLKYIAKEDIYVYSIDEAFLDVTNYRELYHMTAREIGVMLMEDVFRTLGIRAACGIGTNLYLAKIALDITAKHADDFIGYLNEELYRQTLWEHKPLTDFWRVGRGTAERLNRFGITTMKDIARADEALLYRIFGIDAELMIDHAWGREPTTIADIKAYKPQTNSLSSGQVLGCACDFDQGLLLTLEMVDLLTLELVDRSLVTSSVTLYIFTDDKEAKPLRGSGRLGVTTNSYRIISAAFEEIYRRVVPENVRVKRINVAVNDVVDELYELYDLFADRAQLEREKKIRHTVLDIKKKFGKNAILKGMNLKEGAKTVERNTQIGGHRSGIEK